MTLMPHSCSARFYKRSYHVPRHPFQKVSYRAVLMLSKENHVVEPSTVRIVYPQRITTHDL